MTNAPQTIKGLPLAHLNLVAVTVVLGEANDCQDGRGLETELDVLDKAGWDRVVGGMPEVVKCACCGHRLTYACAVEHTPTATGYWVGRDCARKIVALQRFMGSVDQISVALAERAACNGREKVFTALHPEFAEVSAYAKHEYAPERVKASVVVVRRYGSISDDQLRLVVRIVREDAARRAAAAKPLVAGRQQLTGELLGLSTQEDRFNPGQQVTKMLIALPGGTRVWVTKPATFNVGKGDIVTFTGTVELSKRDPLFAFASRPSKVSAQRGPNSESAPAAWGPVPPGAAVE